MITKALLSLAAALALIGCVNPAAQEAGRAVDASIEFQRRLEAEKAECNARVADARFDRIRTRIADEQPTVVQMADDRKPTPAERPIVLQFATILDDCTNKGFSPTIGLTREQRQLALVSLATGQLTYGAYNRKIAELRSAAIAQREQAVAQSAERASQAAATAAATQAGMQAAFENARAQAAADALVDSMSATITNAIFSTRRRR